MEKLTEAQAQEALKAVAEWSLVGEAIQRTFQLKDFVGAMRFINAVADAAESAQHHPDILIRYNLVTLTLATHDAGGITQKDFDLALRIDSIFAGVAGPQPKAAAGGRKK
jgi:4a-hydroxytetrahydrobiopterin dehydratase